MSSFRKEVRRVCCFTVPLWLKHLCHFPGVFESLWWGLVKASFGGLSPHPCEIWDLLPQGGARPLFRGTACLLLFLGKRRHRLWDTDCFWAESLRIRLPCVVRSASKWKSDLYGNSACRGCVSASCECKQTPWYCGLHPSSARYLGRTQPVQSSLRVASKDDKVTVCWKRCRLNSHCKRTVTAVTLNHCTN